MTNHFPTVSARQVIIAVEKLGFLFERQHGSHAFYRHPVTERIVVIPVHSGDMKRGIVSGIVKQTGCSREEFMVVL